MFVYYGALCLVAVGVLGQSDECPNRCMCFKTTVRCMHIHLTTVPKIPESTTVLDLRFNKIRSLQPGHFSHLKELKTLLLNDNQITVLKDGTFAGLSELRQLYLYKNKIREIAENALEGMPKLEQLYLHHNKLENIRPHTFDKLVNLQRLFLHENKIQRIYSGTFATLRSLQRLRLDGNALVCDCNLIWFKKFMSEDMQHAQVAATCQYPVDMQGKSVFDMNNNDFSCNEPRIVEGPHDVEVNFGGSAVFTCRVDGDPKPSITWMVNSNEIDMANPKYTLQDDGTLVVSSTDREDVGTYECFAKSPFGSIKSNVANMKIAPIAEKPSFSKRPIDQTAKEGDTVQLECAVSGDSRPDLSWTKDDLPLNTEKSRVSPEGTLTLDDVTVEDTALYKCILNSPAGRISTAAQLTVNAPPRILGPPETQSVDSGSTVEMRCLPYGHPPPVITWFKDGSSVQPTARLKFLTDSTVLVIKQTQIEDSGLYTCLAQSLHGVAEASGELRVRAHGPRAPNFITPPHSLVATTGSSVEFPCKPQGDPYPALEWRKNGEPLTLDSRHKVVSSGSLRLYNISFEDAGTYGCRAYNENGELTIEASLTVEDSSNIDDNAVVRAVNEAAHSVDRAINSTIATLFSKKQLHTHNPFILMTLLRYPDSTSRSAVRAADIYENTLLNIRRQITAGLHMDGLEDFSYDDILSPDQLQLIARLSGCMEHLNANCSDMCFHSRYRTIDGTCNNLQHPYWGASHTGFRRILKPIYENGFSQPIGWNKDRKYNGYALPSARLVSSTLIRTPKITSDDEITHMVMQWGQFLDHDLDHAIPSTTAESWEGLDCKKSCDYSPPCFPMEVPPGDTRVNNRRCMDFIRSSAICGSGETSVFFNKIQPREQINQLTAFIDGSQVYGFSTNRSILLRDYTQSLGLLRTGLVAPSGKAFLPLAGVQEVDCRRDPTESDVGCFLAGDIRVNEQVSLLAMHTIWLREHNRLVHGLKAINPHWTGETLYNEARKILGAEMQHITFEHWLPKVLGPEGMKMLGSYEGYNPNLEPGISNEFATAALRFGHTLINPVLTRLDHNFQTIAEGDLPLGKAFFTPWRIVDEGGIDPLMRGMFMTAAKKKMPRENLNMELTEHLFTSFHAVSLDLASMNVQRGRDHGLPFYNDYRRACNLTYATSFEDLRNEISDEEVIEKLRLLYGHPNNIDLFVGGILEDQKGGAKIGPTFLCILTDQFRRIRDGDRFWYENPSAFSSAQLTQLKQSSLARILCDNGDNITKITKDIFILPERQDDGVIDCDSIPKVDLRLWYECEGCEKNMSARGRRDLDESAIEDRVEGLEGVVAELQKTVKNLKKRIKHLTANGGCKDHKGKFRKDGDSWQKNACTFCECREMQITCMKIQCAKLNCDNAITEEGHCCPVCQ